MGVVTAILGWIGFQKYSFGFYAYPLDLYQRIAPGIAQCYGTFCDGVSWLR